ncbi:S41 family peptidase [Bacillus anthracis]|uniref:S41 family peptidase n=1 Tax=Bacillus anthracis TaxID=1392 RepID=UPI0001B41324|nr:S41 family peptidase [Bacillus anthracis]AIK31886.1 peptidase S41 family protein [Bacillus anthracis]AJH88565.1 peptidase S41 family protein [Bacillus anthracis]KGZ79414.1 peptidase [Bacillus anthracis]KHA40921.1 peptidase [Bacillus anthracis]UKX86030.1 S41 family peptidase [Bacillus anthracis]
MYIEIFKEIVSITHHDYSGCIDKKGWDDPTTYLQTIEKLEKQGELTPVQFTEIVRDYLLDFKDNHMFFKMISNNQTLNGVGFQVKRYEDRLYITSTPQEIRVKKGQSILALDNMKVPELLIKYKKYLNENTYEREKWDYVLLKSSNCTLIDENGVTKTITLQKYKQSEYTPIYSLKQYNKDTLLITLTDFANIEAINKLFSHKNELNSFQNLIIDVRLNRGGSDDAFFNLLPYLFEDKEISLFDSSDTMQLNHTERNFHLRMKEMEDYDSLDELSKLFTNMFIQDLKKNYKKGFVTFDTSGLPKELQSLKIHGRKSPSRVVILTDVTCGSSGDSFVEVAKKSLKVKVIGRPTAGLNDYSNLAVMEWADTFALYYPTSRLSIIDKGEGMSGIGIQPHIHIPWTPEHIQEDVDLNLALQLLQNEEW